ncbi:MAG: hypothetical protein MUO77_06800, partial [Anaerolineales bacterium]|nr:hypothetical protein [Anaerolineales bacterium]
MKHTLITLLAAIYLTGCATITPVPTTIALPSPTIAITQTPVPTLTPTSTPEPPGTIAGVDTTQYGFEMGELVLKGNEIVYAATGEVAARRNAEIEGGWEWKWGRDLEKHILEVARLGPATYDYNLDSDQQKKIMSGFIGLNGPTGILIELRFGISKNPNHKERDYV